MVSSLCSLSLIAYLATATAVYEHLTVHKVLNWTTASGKLSNIIDGDLNTQWGSDACRREGWRGNSVFNRLHLACDTGVCSATCDGDLSRATDNSPYTAGSAKMNHAEGQSWAHIPFPSGNAEKAQQIYIRGSWPVNTSVWATVESGLPIFLATLGPEQTYSDLYLDPPSVPITGLKVHSTTRDGLMRGYCFSGVGDCKTITITEVAIQTQDCFEQITLDMGSAKEVSQLSLKFSAIYAGMMASSVDGLTFVDRLDLKSFPFSSSKSMVVNIPNITARYLRFRFYTDPDPSHIHDKIYVQDISLFGSNTLKPCPNSCSGKVCVAGTCSCPSGYGGLDCSVPVCDPMCRNGGACVNGQCQCPVGYKGATCEATICANDCWGHGNCVAGTCKCHLGYAGEDCRYEEFQFVNQGVKSSVNTVDYRTTLGPNIFQHTLPPVVTLHNAVSDKCPASKPFLCADKSTCALSKGACALLSSTATSWNHADYDSKRLPVVAFISSSNTASAGAVGDGLDATSWQSGFCYQSGYITISELNLLSNSCSGASSTLCTVSAGTLSDLSKATDLDYNTAMNAKLDNAVAWLEVKLLSPSTFAAVTAKISVASGVTVRVMGKTASGSVEVLGTISTSFTVSNFLVSSSTVFSSVRLESTAAFNVFEVSARSGACMEYAGVDFGSAVEISALTIRHYAGGVAGNVARTVYESSTDGKSWNVISAAGNIPPLLTSALDVHLSPALTARYVRVRHTLTEGLSAKVFVWEISAWGVGGKYGSLPPPSPNPLTYKELLGVNGIWGWGTNQYSSSLSGNQGPGRYNGTFSHARNYHNWNWDVTDPDNQPRYDQMVAPGSLDYGVIPGHSSRLAFNWLNWDNEYSSWRKSGLDVEVSLQFTEKMFPRSVFNRLVKSSYTYGFEFAKHFGPLNGTGDVQVLEIGNEPWEYDADTYSTLYGALVRGIKKADLNMKVMPAAFASLGDFLDRYNQRTFSFVDAFNVHAYSWIQTARGRTGIYPEHPMSTLHAVNSYVRFRDNVVPGLPIYLTEWGWDSAGGGETCSPPAGREGGSDFPECVTEAAQAAYAIRGALVLARKGLSRLTWFFYGNTIQTGASWDSSHGVFSRSGLTSSSTAGFKNKQSLYALNNFINVLGASRFLSVVREDDSAYVYAVGGDDGVTHIVAWLPIDANVDSTEVTATFKFASDRTPAHAWELGRLSLVHCALPVVVESMWTLKLSAFPKVISLF